MRTRIRIVGLGCHRCGVALEAALSGLPGVRSVTMHFEFGDADIEHDASLARAALLEAVESAGYDAF